MNVTDYIQSGILELYVLGMASDEERREVDRMAGLYPEVAQEIDQITAALIEQAEKSCPAPNPTIGAFLAAMVDYTERLQGGEAPTSPPALNKDSRMTDFASWLNNPDAVLPADFEAFHARIIGYSPEYITAIAWLRYGAPPETHKREFERFLILEGTCDITIDKIVHQLVPGDYLEIPLHLSHHVQVTSDMPCKVILQRVAA